MALQPISRASSAYSNGELDHGAACRHTIAPVSRILFTPLRNPYKPLLLSNPIPLKVGCRVVNNVIKQYFGMDISLLKIL